MFKTSDRDQQLSARTFTYVWKVLNITAAGQIVSLFTAELCDHARIFFRLCRGTPADLIGLKNLR